MNTIDQKITTAIHEQTQNMRKYYQLHAQIYDLTRWSFLFGRKQLVKDLKHIVPVSNTILEIGCGTGFNLINLSKFFPTASLIGMDTSKDMICEATKNVSELKNRIALYNRPYQLGNNQLLAKPDVVVFSYALSMINPYYADLIQQAYHDLPEGGHIAVVDFYDSKFKWFRNHMENHHVKMEGHLLPMLREFFTPVQLQVKSAYGGVWEYFSFIGKKESDFF